MKRAYGIAGFALLGLAAAAPASGPIGTYALIEKVVMQPNENAPERVQVWGVFSTVKLDQRMEYFAPVRGYMYFVAPKGKEEVCRKEWADLKKAAGTTECVAMGRYEAPGRVRRPAIHAEPSGPVDPRRVRQLIGELDSDQFAVREKATQDLEKLGEAVAPALRKALANKPSAEVRKRVERLLGQFDEKPDVYPVAMGLWRIKTENVNYPPIRALLALPAQSSPADGSLIESGKITLTAKSVRDMQHKEAKYLFELQNGAGEKETSPPIAAGDKQAQWSPRMEVKPGEKYTWRVWAVDGNWKGPIAAADFKGKAAR